MHTRTAILTISALITCLVFSSLPAHAKITLSGLFSDHMVLQRNAPIRVWGEANPKEILGVAVGENKGVAFADEKGHWNVELKPMKAGGGPHKLVVVGSKDKLEINDVLIGDVFLCSGQSNMAVSIAFSHLEDEVAKYKFNDNMRFISLPSRVSSEREWRVDAKWKKFNYENAVKTSAVATTFAYRMNQELDVPVAVIISAVGGSKIQPWLSRSLLESYPDGRSLVKKVDNIVAALKKQGIDTRNMVLDQASSLTKKIQDDPARQMFLSPTTLFNSMISPLVPYSVKGVLWYQGEANVYESGDYQGLMTNLIKDFRTKWNSPELPFIYVQLAPYGKKQSTPVNSSPVADLRFAQAQAGVVPFSYMAVTLDCCQMDKPDWHASDKVKIGNRLAEIALATQYNKPYAYKSPCYFTYDLKDNKVVLHFKNTHKNLKSEGESVSGFAISGSDKKLLWANAVIKDDSVEVWNDTVKKPAYVYYAWADNPKGNLVGDGNLPAVPFQIELDEE